MEEINENLYALRERQSDHFLGRLFRFHGQNYTRCSLSVIGEPVIVPIPTPTNTTIGFAPKIRDIVEVVADYYRVTPHAIESHDTCRAPTLARQVVFYLASEMTKKPAAHISRVLGGKDRTAVVRGIERITAALNSSPRMADDLDVIRLHIRERSLNRRAAA